MLLTLTYYFEELTIFKYGLILFKQIFDYFFN